MSSNVGLSTPRGSGTSGYVQKNHAHLKPRDTASPYPRDFDTMKQYKQRQPDAAILEHDRRRAIEVQVFELRDRLEDEGVDEDEIETRTGELRMKLEKKKGEEGVKGKGNGGGKLGGRMADARVLKNYQVHELAKAKIEESEKLRKALGIREDYEEGSHWKKGEERIRDGLRNEG